MGILACAGGSKPANPGKRTLASVRLELLLHMMHHRDGSDKDERRNYLVRVKAGMKESPCDAHGGQRLHHLEVTGC